MSKAVALFLLIAFVCGFNASAGTISGRVFDSADSSPLKGVWIYCSAFCGYKSTYSNAKGEFTIEYLTVDASTLPKNTFQPKFFWNSQRKSFFWKKNSGQMSIKIYDISGRNIKAFTGNSQEGEFRINGLAPATCLVEITFQGQRSFFRLLNVSGGIATIARQETENRQTCLEKSLAQKSINLSKCGYGSVTYPIISDEQGLVIYLKQTSPLTPCPSNSDTISWAVISAMSYGDWILQKEGNDGYSSGYACNIRLTDYCNWSIYKGHTGGTGGTYQVINPDSSVIFAWAYNQFSEFVANSKWRGCTKEGVMMGDSLTKFLATYPLFTIKRDTLSKTSTASFVDSIVYFNVLDTIWKAAEKDTTFFRRDTTYMDTSKKYYSVNRYRVVADFDSLEKLKRLDCYYPGRYVD